ncbi:MAG: tRNA (adenosine(37)-N6)-dimethylallyltransferase MiaA [Pseudomonadota bacterium]
MQGASRNSDPVLCLLGPTAAGKTDLAFEIADRFDAEIISVDSALVYREMNIGTAKPDKQTLLRYPHHLIDLINPDQTYSVAQFQKDAVRCIDHCRQRGKVPIIVGGTMMYIKALEEGLSELPCSDNAIRSALQSELQKKGIAGMQADLEKIDPVSARKISANDVQRTLRALEVWHMTGNTLSHLRQRQNTKNTLRVRLKKLAVHFQDRATLHQRIEKRFDQMLDGGFVREVERIRKSFPSLTIQSASMRCVGYRQIWQYIENNISFDQMRLNGVAATRQLAKRQLTWMRGMDSLQWFENNARSRDSILEIVSEQLKTTGND